MQVEDPAAKFSSRGRPHYCLGAKRERESCHMTSDNQPFFHELEISRGFHTWAVPRSLANARKCQLEDFCEKERYESCSVQQTCTADTFCKVQKGENMLVVLLLLGSTTVLLLRNPCVLYQKHGGACTKYLR